MHLSRLSTSGCPADIRPPPRTVLWFCFTMGRFAYAQPPPPAVCSYLYSDQKLKASLPSRNIWKIHSAVILQSIQFMYIFSQKCIILGAANDKSGLCSQIHARLVNTIYRERA